MTIGSKRSESFVVFLAGQTQLNCCSLLKVKRTDFLNRRARKQRFSFSVLCALCAPVRNSWALRFRGVCSCFPACGKTVLDSFCWHVTDCQTLAKERNLLSPLCMNTESSPRFNRRRFIATAGAALALPVFVPGCAVGSQRTWPSAASPLASSAGDGRGRKTPRRSWIRRIARWWWPMIWIKIIWQTAVNKINEHYKTRIANRITITGK